MKKLATKVKGSSRKKPAAKRKINFEKLSPEKKRIVIAEDVLTRLRTKQIDPTQGKFCNINFDAEPNGNTPDDSVSLQTVVNKRKNTCEACAKGALFVSMIGFANEFQIGDLTDGTWTWGGVRGNRLGSKEMRKLGKFFSKKQLTLIESTFENDTFDFNVNLTSKEIERCKNFHTKYYNKNYEDKDVLRAICKNIVKNGGEFRP